MKVYTSYYGNRNIPRDLVKVSISNSNPIPVSFKLQSIVPDWSIVDEYKRDGDEEKYTKKYLEKLN